MSSLLARGSAIFGAGVLALLAARAQAADCSVDEKPLLAETYAQFDEDPQGGWRPLADKDGCLGAAAGGVQGQHTESPSPLIPANAGTQMT